jgi:uncharacterized protein YktB (UPF0637 family)
MTNPEKSRIAVEARDAVKKETHDFIVQLFESQVFIFKDISVVDLFLKNIIEGEDFNFLSGYTDDDIVEKLNSIASELDIKRRDTSHGLDRKILDRYKKSIENSIDQILAIYEIKAKV